MILATTQVEDFDRFEKIFSTKGAEKQKQHGSKGATVFRDPTEEDRVWRGDRIGPIRDSLAHTQRRRMASNAPPRRSSVSPPKAWACAI